MAEYLYDIQSSTDFLYVETANETTFVFRDTVLLQCPPRLHISMSAFGSILRETPELHRTVWTPKISNSQPDFITIILLL
jgi:hypothetical protein